MCVLLQNWFVSLIRNGLPFHLTDDEEEEAAEQVTDKTFDPTEIENTIKILSSKIEDLTTCNNLIVNHGTQLQRSLAELDHMQSASGDTSTKMKAINERATLFRITTNAMINVSLVMVYAALRVTGSLILTRKWRVFIC